MFGSNEIFKTEIGSVSIPTLESIHGMMPEKDWEVINDDWAEHDLAKGAQKGDLYPRMINQRYGTVANLADFARKGQLANYEAYRAMYEGRNARMFKPCTGIITWMSNPAQPSFVWQLYHHDLEPNASLFAVRKACEPVHIQLNEKNWGIEIINNLSAPLHNARADLAVYNLDGSAAFHSRFQVNAAASAETSLDTFVWPTNFTHVHFVKLELYDADNRRLSDNFYWRTLPGETNSLRDLGSLPVVTLEAHISRHDMGENCVLEVTLTNSSQRVALMAHLQLRRKDSCERVLPVYCSDNYVSFVPGESKKITIEAALSDLKGQKPLIVVDGWNISVTPSVSADAALQLNEEALVSHWPVTGLPFAAQ